LLFEIFYDSLISFAPDSADHRKMGIFRRKILVDHLFPNSQLQLVPLLWSKLSE